MKVEDLEINLTVKDLDNTIYRVQNEICPYTATGKYLKHFCVVWGVDYSDDEPDSDIRERLLKVVMNKCQ